MPKEPVCDLCSGGDIRWTYITRSNSEVTFEDPQWAVCGACDELVQREDRKGLLERALGRQVVFTNSPSLLDGFMKEYAEHVATTHHHFLTTWCQRFSEPGYRIPKGD